MTHTTHAHTDMHTSSLLLLTNSSGEIMPHYFEQLWCVKIHMLHVQEAWGWGRRGNWLDCALDILFSLYNNPYP